MPNDPTTAGPHRGSLRSPCACTSRWPPSATAPRIAEAQLGDKVVGVAAIDGARELDHPARREIGRALDVEAGDARGDFEEGCVFLFEILGPDALDGTHRPVIGLLQMGIER